MSYRFVFTAEKSGSDVFDALIACPGWADVVTCFQVDNPFATIQGKVSEDKSYVEWTVNFVDREVYELWHEAYSELHDQSRGTAMAAFEAQGGTIGLYNEGVDLSHPDRARPIEEFVSRFPEDYPEFIVSYDTDHTGSSTTAP